MKHTYKLEGYCYLLRPIKRSDAATIVDIRRGDSERNRYIHSIPLDVAVQEQWLRSEEHTSELQSRQYLVCRLLLEKKNVALTVGVFLLLFGAGLWAFTRMGHRFAMVERGVGLVKKKRRIAFSVFFFNDTATTEIYTLSLHDALPI